MYISCQAAECIDMLPRDSAMIYFAGLSFAVHVGLFVGPVGHMIAQCAFVISAMVNFFACSCRMSVQPFLTACRCVQCTRFTDNAVY